MKYTNSMPRSRNHLRRGDPVLAPQATDVQALVHPEIAHSIPGRIRLKFAPHDSAQGYWLARRLVAHPAVHSATWNSAGRSLTVRYDAAQEFSHLLDTLPQVVEGREEAPAAERHIDWGKVFASCLVSLIPLGPLGNVAVAFATSVLEQSALASVSDRVPPKAPSAGSTSHTIRLSHPRKGTRLTQLQAAPAS
jgi:Zn-dependent protease